MSWSDLIPFRRRTKSRHVDDKAVDDFARVAKAQGLPLDYRPDGFKEALTDFADGKGLDDLEGMARKLGQIE